MLFWILLFILIVAMSIVFKNRIYFVWFFIWIVTAFRYKVGTDYMGYISLYNSFGTENFNPHYYTDLGLMSTLSLIHWIGGGPQMLFVIYGALSCFFYYKAFKYYAQGNQSLNILFVILYMGFLFFQTLSIMRFTLAGAILFYTTRYIVEGKLIKYFFGVLFAMVFHLSAIVFLPIYFIRYIRFGHWLLPTFFLLSLFVVFFHPIQKLLEILVGFNTPYMYYLTNEKYTTIHASTFGMVNTYLYMLFAFTTHQYFRRNTISRIVFLLFLVFVFFRVLSIDMFIFQRLSQYFKPFLIVYLGYLLVNMTFYIKEIKCVLYLVLISLVLIYGVLAGSLFGLSVRDYIQKRFYTQYAIDIGLFGKPYPIQIYGDYHTLPNYWK